MNQDLFSKRIDVFQIVSGWGLLWAALLVCALVSVTPSHGEGEDMSFEIKGYMVEGNSLLSLEEIDLLLEPFTGTGKNAETVNKAKEALEKHYHAQGYPAVLVNIPLQTLDNNMVKFQVIESRIAKVRVSGNTYFTMKRLMRSLPSITPGRILYLPQLEKELNRLNRNQHITVAPVLGPGREVGTIDVELKVTDRLPLHGSLEVNNYSSHTTTDLRTSAKINYDNFWQRDHSLSLQLQTSPEDLDEVRVFAGSYLMGSLLNEDHMVSAYAVWSDSDVAILDDLRVVSKGSIAGIRYIVPLPPLPDYYHTLTLGMDYKHFTEVIDLNPAKDNSLSATDETAEDDETESVSDPEEEDESGSGEDEDSGIDYLPFSITYGATADDPWGRNTLSAGIGFALRGVVSNQREFESKRYKAMASYMVFNSSLSREHTLPAKNALYSRITLQLANMPLISNEQFFAGGAASVRGYKENEAAGDSGVSATLELRIPDAVPLLEQVVPRLKRFAFKPYLFYDIATLSVYEPLPGQPQSFTLQGTGMGARGTLSRHLQYQLDLGYPLIRTEKVNSGDLHFYFKVTGHF